MYAFMLATVTEHAPPFPEPLALHFFKQLMEGVAAMHGHSIFHGDLKTENLMIDKNQETGEYLLRVGDFGLMRVPDAASPSGQIPVLRATSDGVVSSPRRRAAMIMCCIVLQRVVLCCHGQASW